jgi:hypothetical protein
MKITLDYRHPTPSHCDVAVFVNGALAGVLTLRQEELGTFQHIVLHGMDNERDQFLGTGDPGPDPLATTRLRERVETLEALLREVQNARGLLMYGEHWIRRIDDALR